MEPLTQQEVDQLNTFVATLGREQKQQKDEILGVFKSGGDEWIAYARALINKQ